MRILFFQSLKTLIFGTPMQSFSDEWRYQSFSFSDLPKLKYGIVQKKVGSFWNAYVLKYLSIKC